MDIPQGKFDALLASIAVGSSFQLTAANLGDIGPDEFHEFAQRLYDQGGNKFRMTDVTWLSDGSNRITRAKIIRTS